MSMLYLSVYSNKARPWWISPAELSSRPGLSLICSLKLLEKNKNRQILVHLDEHMNKKHKRGYSYCSKLECMAACKRKH